MFSACGQTKTDTAKTVVSFDTLIGHFNEYNFENDTMRLPLIFTGDNYKVVLSSNPISLNLADTVFKNPYGKTYPLSYSVVYQNNLVTLFEPGKFVSYNLDKLERNLDLESKLNTKKFNYHWILNSQLVAQSGNQYFYFAGDSWKAYANEILLKKQPKLFEDEKYICFFDCHGEWGGTVYFYNKNSNKTYFTEATCANMITKKDNKYYVLSTLGHMMGSAESKEISNPDQLSELKRQEVNKPFRGAALRYSDSTKHAKQVFDFFGIQIFSSFPIYDRKVYLVNWRHRAFLAELNDTTFSIVHPLFDDELYTHRPVTTLNPDNSIINLDLYGIAGEREVSILLIEDNKITRIDWNEKHNR
jgi:hypothetical protein